MKLLYGTHWISEDEPCYWLWELNRVAPDGKIHRYQKIWVMRGDDYAEYQQDLGLAEQFKHCQVNIPGGGKDERGVYKIEHTVGELRDIADFMRNRPNLDLLERVGLNKIKT